MSDNNNKITDFVINEEVFLTIGIVETTEELKYAILDKDGERTLCLKRNGRLKAQINANYSNGIYSWQNDDGNTKQINPGINGLPFGSSKATGYNTRPKTQWNIRYDLPNNKSGFAKVKIFQLSESDFLFDSIYYQWSWAYYSNYDRAYAYMSYI